jgi:low temperature requirement protein LtrA
VETKIGRLVYANGRPGGTAATITLLLTFIMILLTVRLPTHLEQTKSVCAIIYLYVKKLDYA